MRKRYDWEKWFKRREFTLEKGRDYVCSQSAIAQQIRSEASRRGVSVHVADTGTGVIVLVRRRKVPC